MRRPWLGVMAVLAFGFGVIGSRSEAQHQEPSPHDIRVKWAFGGLKKGKQKAQLVAITRDTVLETGDELKMLLEIEEKCYAYVIYQGPKDQIRLLFPYAVSDLHQAYQESKVYYIPREEGWFELDDQVGQETFHLLVSSKRLRTLEGLIAQYDTVGSEDKPALAAEIVAEIKRLRRQHRSLKAPAERPVQIVGRIRGADETAERGRPDIDRLAIEISAETFYSRTFTIEHK